MMSEKKKRNLRLVICFFLLYLADLPIGNAPPSMYDEYPMTECNLFVDYEYSRSGVLINAAKFIIWSLESDNGIMEYLRKLMHSIESFYHPSNEGPWTSPIGDFLLTLTINFAKRLEKQRKQQKDKESKVEPKNREAVIFEGSFLLTPEQVSQFVDIALPIAMTSMYSKSKQLVFCSRHIIKHISYLAPEKLFPQLMERCSHALQTLTETHQAVTALETLALVVFPMLNHDHYPDGPKYLGELLMLTIPGIDSNDLRKTYACLQFYSSFLACIPLSAKMPSSSKKSESTLESIPYFEDWCIQFLDRLFQVLSSQGPPKDGQSSDGIDPDMFWGICDMFFNQLSDDLYDQCVKKVFTFATNSLLVNAKKNVGHMCGAAVYTRPEKALKLFVPTLFDRLVDNTTGKLRNLTTQELSYFLYLLSQVVFCSGAELLKYRHKLNKVIELTWDHEEKPVVKGCGKLIRNILRTCTFYYSKDLRSVNPSVWQSDHFKTEHYEFWAQFPPIEDLEVNWHIPSQEELDFAAEIVNLHMSKIVDRVRNYIDALPDNTSASLSQQSKSIRHCLVLLNYMLKASSVLFSEISTGIHTGKSRYPDSIRIESGLCQYDQSKLKLGYESLGDLFCDLTEALVQHRPDTEPKMLSLIAKTIYPIFCVRGGCTGAGYRQKLRSQEYIKRHTFRSFSHQPSIRYPRYVQVLRTILSLKLRFVLHSESLDYTDTHERLIKNLITLSLCSYSSVRRKAQDVLMASVTKFSHKVLESFLPRVIATISDTSSTDEQITGARYIIERPSSVRTILLDWDLLSQLMMSLCQTSHVEKQTVQDRLLELYDIYFASFYQTSMDDRAVELYHKLVHDILDLAERNPNWHWKFQIMVASLFSLLIRTDSRVLFPIAGVKWLFRALVSDIERLRQIAVDALNLLFAQYKPIHPRKLVKLDSASSMFYEWQKVHFPTNREEWEKIDFFEKNWFGWYSLPEQAQTYIYSKDPEELKKNISQDKTKQQRGELVNELRGIMTSEFIKKFFELHVVREDAFNEGNAQFFKGMFQLFGEDFVDTCKPHFEHMLGFAGCGKQEESHYMGSAAEWTGGLLRGIKHWNFDQQMRVYDYIFPLLERVLDQCSNNCVSDWSEAIEFSICDKDPRRCYWIRNLLLRLFEKAMNNPSSSSAQQTRYLKVVYAVLGELGWRDMRSLEHVLEVLTQHLQHPYQQVRTYVSLFTALICKLMWSPERDEKGVPIIHRSLHQVNPKELQYAESMESIPTPVLTFLKSIETQLEATKELGNQDSSSTSLSGSPHTPNDDSMMIIDSTEESIAATPPAGDSKKSSSSSAQPDAVTMANGKQDDPGKTAQVDTKNGPKLRTPIKPSVPALVTRFKATRSPMSPISPTSPLSMTGSPFSTASTTGAGATGERMENNAFKSLSRTMLITIGGLYSQCAPNSVVPYTTQLMAALTTVQENCDDEEILEMTREAALIIASFPYSIGMAKKLLRFFVDTYSKSSNWKTRANLLDVLQIFGFLNQFYLMDEQETLFDLILTMMKDSQFEVREMASQTLAGFLKMSEMALVEQMASTFVDWAKKPVVSTTRRKRRRSLAVSSSLSGTPTGTSTPLDPEEAKAIAAVFAEDIKRHSGVLGISAIIMAFPYDLPDVLIPLMVKLAKFSTDSSNSIRETVKKTFAQFWKTHHDTWSLHKSKFTDDQLLELTDLLVSPSYYA